jgi:methylmalonyl-CoA/ethylmalonyl-CoA epimerase
MDHETRGVRPARIGQIHLSVQDLDRARAFYRDVLGLAFLFDAPPGMAFFQCGDVRLMLGRPESPDEAPRTSLLYYSVEDIAEAHRTLDDHGAHVEHGPHVVHRTPDMELWMGFYRDSEGNVFATMEERAS